MSIDIFLLAPPNGLSKYLDSGATVQLDDAAVQLRNWHLQNFPSWEDNKKLFWHLFYILRRCWRDKSRSLLWWIKFWQSFHVQTTWHGQNSKKSIFTQWSTRRDYEITWKENEITHFFFIFPFFKNIDIYMVYKNICMLSKRYIVRGKQYLFICMCVTLFQVGI